MVEPQSHEKIAGLQLQLIEEIHHLLSHLDIPHWLDGGWALDFLLGEITREHKDIDWLIWKTDASKVRIVLEQHDYRHQSVRHPEEHLGFYKHQLYISFTLNELNERGQSVTCGRWQDWPWSDGAFSAPPGHLGDIVCPIVSAEAQLDVRENYHKHPAGAPMRPDDPSDIEKLRAYIAKQNSSG